MQVVNMRLKFKKGEEVKYISHLDLMRTFQRAIRRAGIPVSYSSGFNPHQEISFGAPLSLGVTSDAEYLDIKLNDEITVCEVKDKLNETLPEGIKILDGIILPDKAKSAMSLVTHSKYTIRLVIDGINLETLQGKLHKFINQNEIMIMKEQPKKNFALKEIDIKPLINKIEVMTGNLNEYFMKCILASGSKANLKPELLLEAFRAFSDYHIKGVKINREEVYAAVEGRLLDLIEVSKRSGRDRS